VRAQRAHHGSFFLGEKGLIQRAQYAEENHFFPSCGIVDQSVKTRSLAALKRPTGSDDWEEMGRVRNTPFLFDAEGWMPKGRPIILWAGFHPGSGVIGVAI